MVPNSKNFKTTKHDYRLNFQYATKVAEVEGGLVIACPFSLVSLEEILGNFDSNYLVGM